MRGERRGGVRLLHCGLVALLLVSIGMTSCAWPSMAASNAPKLSFSLKSGLFTLTFDASKGLLQVRRTGKSSAIRLTEVPGDRASNLLKSTRKVRRSSHGYTVTGVSKWAAFSLALSFGPPSGLLHYSLKIRPRIDASIGAGTLPDAGLVAGHAGLTAYAAAPPIAGSSVFLSSKDMNASLLYLENYTALGAYFDRTNSGVTQGNFSYPNAGTKGSLVGVARSNTFGYLPPADTLSSLPHGKWTTVEDTYLALSPDIPKSEGEISDRYLSLLGTVYGNLTKPTIPVPDWKAYAANSAHDLLDAANLVTVDGHQYLKSYLSDTRSSPELITQAGVLAGVQAYERKYGVSLPLDAILESNLQSFYSPQFHSITNNLAAYTDSSARGESWYFVDNMISLLRLAQGGSGTARKLLLDSKDALITLAHVNHYEFPLDFLYRDWSGAGTGVQPDVAGGYSWLMLGLHDLTGDAKYLDEARAAIDHISGKGFSLSYETHMTAYSAAAAQRLFVLTKNPIYHAEAELALANLVHATRLWDCTYALCRKGAGYHTFMGLNPLPWSDYIAILEQYEAWLGLQDYLKYAHGEPAYILALVNGFVVATPATLQYTLPPRLPQGAATRAPAEYSNVPRNDLSRWIPLEDLREGDSTSGVIGQEIYGAGGVFWFAVSGP